MLMEAGIGRGSAVGVLAGEPATIAPAAQAVWLVGGSVTMLHQPTARTDLALWAKETVGVLTMIGAKLVLLGAPFEGLASVLSQHGIPCRLLTDLEGAPVTPDPDAGTFDLPGADRPPSCGGRFWLTPDDGRSLLTGLKKNRKELSDQKLRSDD